MRAQNHVLPGNKSSLGWPSAAPFQEKQSTDNASKFLAGSWSRAGRHHFSVESLKSVERTMHEVSSSPFRKHNGSRARLANRLSTGFQYPSWIAGSFFSPRVSFIDPA